MLEHFGVFSFLQSWKLTRVLTNCISATSFKIWTFSPFLYISETTRTIFFKSLHIIFIMYMSETFIKIDSQQHLEISRQTYPTDRSKIRATTFTVLTLCCGQYTYPWSSERKSTGSFQSFCKSPLTYRWLIWFRSMLSSAFLNIDRTPEIT